MRSVVTFFLMIVSILGTAFAMAALAADRQTGSRAEGLDPYPVATAVTIFKGSIVAVNDAGFAIPAADAAAARVIGVADEKVVNAGADGAKIIRVRSGEAYDLAATSITQAMVGDIMHVVDDQTFDEATGTNGVVAGRLMEFISTTRGMLFIPRGGCRKAGIPDGTYSANEQAILADTLN